MRIGRCSKKQTKPWPHPSRNHTPAWLTVVKLAQRPDTDRSRGYPDLGKSLKAPKTKTKKPGGKNHEVQQH